MGSMSESEELWFLRQRLEQMARDFEFADSKGEYRAVVAQLRAILAEKP